MNFKNSQNKKKVQIFLCSPWFSISTSDVHINEEGSHWYTQEVTGLFIFNLFVIQWKTKCLFSTFGVCSSLVYILSSVWKPCVQESQAITLRRNE